MRVAPWRDCADLIEELCERELQRQRDSENLAMLVDRHDFWLTFDYISDTTDPNDPDVKRQRAKRKQLRLKPPPLPLLEAVALRSPEMTERVAELYAQRNGRTDQDSAQPDSPPASPLHHADGTPKSKFELMELAGWG